MDFVLMIVEVKNCVICSLSLSQTASFQYCSWTHLLFFALDKMEEWKVYPVAASGQLANWITTEMAKFYPYSELLATLTAHLEGCDVCTKIPQLSLNIFSLTCYCIYISWPAAQCFYVIDAHQKSDSWQMFCALGAAPPGLRLNATSGHKRDSFVSHPHSLAILLGRVFWLVASKPHHQGRKKWFGGIKPQTISRN